MSLIIQVILNFKLTPDNYTKYKNSNQQNNKGVDIMQSVFYLRLKLSLLLSQGFDASNTNLFGILKRLAKKPDNEDYNTCRFFILSLLQSKIKFLEDPNSEIWQFIPECQGNRQELPCMFPFSGSIREGAWPKIRKWVLKVEERMFSEEPFTPKKLKTPEEFYGLCLEIVNIRFRLSASGNDHMKKFEVKIKSLMKTLEAKFSKLQMAYLQNLVEGFTNSAILGFPPQNNRGGDNEFKIGVIMMVISVTSYCIAFLSEDWVFSAVIGALQKSQMPPIFINFKNILIMNKNLNKNIQGRKFYQCKNCKTPFSVGNCGQTNSLGRCVKCNLEIGGENHTMNSNTESIEIEDFQNKKLQDPNYFIDRYNADLEHQYDKFEPFAFRVGHLFSHCLYLGLAESGIFPRGQVYKIMLKNFQMNFSNLKIPDQNLGIFFYRHIDRDLEAIQKILKRNSQPVKFVSSLVQLIHDAKPELIGKTLKQSERAFRKYFQRFSANYTEIVTEIDKFEAEYKGSVAKGSLCRKLVSREVDYDLVQHKVDEFLFMVLRENASLDLNNFEIELYNYKQNHPKVDLAFLDFYLSHKVGIFIFKSR